MSQPVDTLAAPKGAGNPSTWLFLLLAAAVALAFFVFWNSLTSMVAWWDREEYSHGYMIPAVALFLLWQRLNQLPGAVTRGSWLGLLFLFMGLMAFVAGEMSAIYTIIQYGFLLTLYGLVLAFFGTGGSRILLVPLAYLIFMIPLPNFFYNNLSSQLQLISSVLGVAVIRMFDISVYLEGNVIDLGAMQLQVAEACSGLRYLFPLMSFGFLIACFYRGPFWQKALLFLSTIPITILMNSFRIGAIGVSVDKWGIEMAEGFLHDFEGWVVFMGCIGILFIEIGLLQVFSRDGKKILDRLNLDVPPLSIRLSDFKVDAERQRPFLAALLIFAAATPFLININERTEIVPQRQPFSDFPLAHNGWVGHAQALDPLVLDTLRLTDYVQANYSKENTRSGSPVNLYIAWYGSQKKGEAIHSPRTCIPGGGWRIASLEQREIANVKHVSGKPLHVNRALIQKGEVSQVVYYWFEGRNRDITNEYAAKWYVFWDSMIHSRSDGALVRLVTFVRDPSELAEADRQLEQFAQDFYPLLPSYTP